MDSAEEIAKAVQDITLGRIKPMGLSEKSLVTDYQALTKEVWQETMRTQVVVDSTLLYSHLHGTKVDLAIHLYEDHVLTPVWERATIGFINEHQNLKLFAYWVLDKDNLEHVDQWQPDVSKTSASLSSFMYDGEPHVIDWDRVKWVYQASAWVGGYARINKTNERKRVPTCGPAHAWSIAVYEDGEIADIRWTLTAKNDDPEDWLVTLLVALHTINFANATNVVLVEPSRPRAQQRRLDRYGIKVRTIHVLPTGVTRRSATDRTTPGMVPLTSVRGHWARYGPKYNRGLLFGKIEGKFWIPQHAIGCIEAGENKHDYRIEPEGA